jgi:hypothetical protein
LQIAGVVVSVLGIVMLAYFVYSLLSFGGRGTYAGTPFRHVTGYNGTVPNGSALNVSARAYYSTRMAGPVRSGLYPILSGILMLLLGVTVFKYGKLKAGIASN